MDLLKPFRQFFQYMRVRSCTWHEWEIHQEAENLWFHDDFVFGTEFVRGEKPKQPGKFWCPARVATCRKCGGTLDEITLGNKILGEKSRAKIHGYQDLVKYTKGCGTTYEWM